MDYKDIEQLLERYWQCETSPEEEAALRAFFLGKDVPAHLLRYKSLFVYQQKQREIRLGDDFDARILARIEKPVVKARRISVVSRFVPLMKAAAAVALILTLGNVARHSFVINDGDVLAADTIGEQATAPSMAQSTHDVKMEKTSADSLVEFNKIREEIKEK